VGGTEDFDLDSFVMHLRYVEEDSRWKFAGCGGTLISSCHILTAAHCMTGDRAERTKAVYVNAWRPFSNNTDASTGRTKPYHVSLIDMEKTAIHPNFNNTGNLNDIAVLTMTKCLPEETSNLFEIMEIANQAFWQEMHAELFLSTNTVSTNPTNKTRVAGFGQLDPDDTSVPPALQSVDVTLFGRDDCEAKFRTNIFFTSSNLIQADMYCAGAPSGGKDACLGDSGGPNYFTDPATSKRTQLGVVSWGIGCAQEEFPGVYTSVAYHYDFIQTAVCMDERLGDFGATSSTALSQSTTTAASPLKLCLPNDIPAPNNSGGGNVAGPIVVGNDDLENEIQDVAIQEEDIPEVSSCSSKSSSCKRDDECCDDLVCNRRDQTCTILPRQDKGRLTDGGSYGGAASSQIRNADFDDFDRRKRRERVLRGGLSLQRRLTG